MRLECFQYSSYDTFVRVSFFENVLFYIVTARRTSTVTFKPLTDTNLMKHMLTSRQFHQYLIQLHLLDTNIAHIPNLIYFRLGRERHDFSLNFFLIVKELICLL